MSASTNNNPPITSTLEKGISGELSESQFIHILDAVSEAISLHDDRGKIVWANKRIYELYGQTHDKLEGLSCQQVFHEDGSVCSHNQNVAETGSRSDELVEMAGATYSITIQPLSVEGTNSGFLRVMRDVTAERQAQKLLLDAERFATLGQLFSGLVHDVGTPLNIISGYSEFLLMRTKPDEPGYKEQSAILFQTKRIADLLEEAVDLARLPQARILPIDLQMLFTQLLSLMEHHFHKAGVKSEMTCRITTPLIYGEASQLKQAFFHLLINAGRKLEGGGHLEVVIAQPSNQPESLAVEISGIDASGRAHDYSSSLSGLPGEPKRIVELGMGLLLARDILDKAGAKIGFGENRDSSTSLVVCLPVKSGAPVFSES
jgi:PAS domain S-box-containing protein